MFDQTENIPEQRLVKRLRTYWDRIRENDDVPFAIKFNNAGISDIWESCILIKVGTSGAKKTYNIERIGTQLTEAVGRDMSGKYFMSSDSDGGILSREFINVMNNSIDKKEFLLSEGSFVNKKGRIIKYRDCVMPLKDNKGEVNLLVVGISWRSF